MIDKERIKKAESNVSRYLEDFLLKKEKNETAKTMYIKNSELSLETSQRLLELEDENYKPYLWVIVASYYSMFYITNAVLLNMGYKIGDKICHKIAEDCLIALVKDKLKKELLEEYETAKDEALEIISLRVDSIIESFKFEREKRSIFQYQMDEDVKKSKALTSLERAKRFVFEMKKLLKS
jgi:uncharacterized protein (UPF0332 family)